jgi:hypothetical protein
MRLVENLNRYVPFAWSGIVPSACGERINSPLQRHEVRLRGLGGLSVCGVPGTGASAAGIAVRVLFWIGTTRSCMHPYQPRPILFHGLRSHGEWRVKLYSITWDAAHPVEWPRFQAGLELAYGELPGAARAQGRAGVGFAIAHQGRNADYVVLGWWDRENELPMRVFVREGTEGWRPARGGESFCVWNLQVLWAEREAYVATVLAPGAAGLPHAVDAYLERHLAVEPAGAGAGRHASHGLNQSVWLANRPVADARVRGTPHAAVPPSPRRRTLCRSSRGFNRS